MPWCPGCDRYYNPATLAPDGTCQQCGRFIASPDDDPDDEESTRAPWHFFVLLAALVVYLGWRLVEAIIWLGQRF